MKKLFVLVTVIMLVMVGCGSKPTLSKWVDSDEVVAAEELSNAELADGGLGLSVKFSADGEDILVLDYIYEQYQNLTGRNQSEIDAAYADELNLLGMSTNIVPIFEECEEATGITLKCIRVRFVNADGTVIYSQDYVNTHLS